MLLVNIHLGKVASLLLDCNIDVYYNLAIAILQIKKALFV